MEDSDEDGGLGGAGGRSDDENKRLLNNVFAEFDQRKLGFTEENSLISILKSLQA